MATTRSRRSPTTSRGSSRPERPPKAWYIAFGIALTLLTIFLTAITVPRLGRHRRLGKYDPRRLGLRHHQLRVLDRHRPRRHADQRDLVPAPSELAHVDQPLRGSDDDLRRDLRRHLPGRAHRSAVAAVLHDADPEPDGDVAAVPEPAGVGHLRGQHLRDDLDPVLVHGHDPGLRDLPRSLDDHDPALSSTASSPWAGAARLASGTATSART